MESQVVGVMEEAAKMFRQRVEIEYDRTLVKAQQKALNDYDEFVKKRRDELVDEIMAARERIVNSVVVEALKESELGSHVRIYLRADSEQSE